MAKYFYIIGTHDESDSTRVITRAGRKEFALEFIHNMSQCGQEEYYIFESNENRNEDALKEFDSIWFDPIKRSEYVTKKVKNYITTPEIGNNNEGESQMDKTKLSNGLMLIANGFALCSQAFGGVMAELAKTNEEPKTEAPKEEKAKKTKTTKTKEVIEETKVEEVTASEEDFGDFDDFSGEENKKTYTVEDIRAACISHAKKNTKEKTYAILKEFGAKSPNDIKAESYNDVMAKLGA